MAYIYKTPKPKKPELSPFMHRFYWHKISQDSETLTNLEEQLSVYGDKAFQEWNNGQSIYSWITLYRERLTDHIKKLGYKIS